MFSLFYDTHNNVENDAAIKIQKVTRGHLVRKRSKPPEENIINESKEYETIDTVKEDEPDSEKDDVSESESESSDSESESDDDENMFYILHVDDKPISYILSHRKNAYKTMWKYARRIKFNHSVDKRCFIKEKGNNELEIVGSYRLFAVTIDHTISKLKLYKVYLKI